MAVSLQWSVSVTYPSNTEGKVSVTLKAKSTSGSYNLTSSSYGYIKIDGTKYGNFSHTFKANTTTTLGTKSKTITRGTAAKSVSLYAWWHTDVSSGNISKSGSTTVAARPAYTVTFNANGGTGTTSRTVYYGYTTTFPTTARTGYTFNSWSGYAQGATTPAIYSNTTYTASWTPITYSISYDLQGGADNNPTTYYTYESATISLTVPTRTGYYFLGWTGSNGSEPQREVTIPTNSTGDKSYIANWRLNVYNIILNPNEGTVNPISLQKTHGTDVTLPTPTRSNYIFAGWEYDNNNIGTICSIDGNNDNDNINLTAIWDNAVRPVVFHYYGSVSDINSTYQIYKVKNTVISSLPTPNITNYRFDGWYTDNNFTNVITQIDNTYDLSPSEYEHSEEHILDLYGKWVRQYTIQFTPGQDIVTGDSVSPTGSKASIIRDVNTSSGQLGNPLLSFSYSGGGCTATNWKDNDTGTTYTSSQSLTLTRDYNLSPNWTKQLYNIVLKSSENSSYGADKTESSYYWDNFIFPSIVTNWSHENWHISGWQSSNDSSNIKLPGSQMTVTGASTWIAQWVNSYHIPVITSLTVKRYLEADHITENNGGKYLVFEALGQHGSYDNVTVTNHVYNVDIKFYDTEDVVFNEPVATFQKVVESTDNTFSGNWTTIDKGLNMKYCVLTIIDNTNYGHTIDENERTFTFSFIIPLERAIAIHIADDLTAISLFKELSSGDKGLVVKNNTITVDRNPISPLEVATKNYVDSIPNGYIRNSVGSLDWSNTEEGVSKVITKAALAFWDGSYIGTSSNLAYCNKGAFGTLATKSLISEVDDAVYIRSDGVVEVDRIIDMHALNENNDYAVRLTADGGGSTGAGTLNITAAGGLLVNGTNISQKGRAFQKYAGSTSVTSGGSVNFNVEITSYGGPLLILASCCWNGNTNGAWSSMYISRGTTVLTQTTMVSTTASHNCPGALVYLDTVSAGTYTYTCTLVSGSGDGTFSENNSGRSEAPALCVIEL